MIKNKKAAMEMSVGTIVTIVLLMAVLVLGLVLIRTIFTSSVENVKAIDENIKSQITTLFAEDNSKKVIIYPTDRSISLNPGDSGGFAFSVRNTGNDAATFQYTVNVAEVAHNCQMSEAQADTLLILGREDDFSLPSLQILEHPIHVNFEIPEEAPKCAINYELRVDKEGELCLQTINILLEIE